MDERAKAWEQGRWVLDYAYILMHFYIFFFQFSEKKTRPDPWNTRSIWYGLVENMVPQFVKLVCSRTAQTMGHRVANMHARTDKKEPKLITIQTWPTDKYILSVAHQMVECPSPSPCRCRQYKLVSTNTRDLQRWNKFKLRIVFFQTLTRDKYISALTRSQVVPMGTSLAGTKIPLVNFDLSLYADPGEA